MHSNNNKILEEQYVIALYSCNNDKCRQKRNIICSVYVHVGEWAIKRNMLVYFFLFSLFSNENIVIIFCDTGTMFN